MPWRRRIVPYADPLHLGRHPFQTYMLSLAFVSGLPLVLGHPTAGSVEATLSDWQIFAWGFCLIVGPAIALVGSYWRGSYANGLTIETVGLTLVGTAAVVYATVLAITFHLTGFTALCILLGFGVSAWKRALDNFRILSRAIEGTSRRVVVREGETEEEAVRRLSEGGV